MERQVNVLPVRTRIEHISRWTRKLPRHIRTSSEPWRGFVKTMSPTAVTTTKVQLTRRRSISRFWPVSGMRKNWFPSSPLHLPTSDEELEPAVVPKPPKLRMSLALLLQTLSYTIHLSLSSLVTPVSRVSSSPSRCHFQHCVNSIFASIESKIPLPTATSKNGRFKKKLF